MNARQFQKQLLALLSSLLLTLAAPAQDSYAFEVIHVLDATNIFASGINNRGVIVGNVEDGSIYGEDGEMFIKDGDKLPTFSIPGTVSSHASAINNAGTVVGYCVTPDAQEVGFARSRIGRVSFLRVAGATSVRAFGINNSGLIVGQVVDQDLNSGQPFFHGFIAEEEAITLYDVPGAAITRFDQVDSSGRIVGFSQQDLFHAGTSFVTKKQGRYAGAFHLPNTTSASILAISPEGILAGIYTDAAGAAHSFILKGGKSRNIELPGWNWKPDFVLEDMYFGALHFVFQNSASFITGINDRKEIIVVNSASYYETDLGLIIQR